MTRDWEQKVRRTIFISQDLEVKLAKLASERDTSTNDLICELLTAGVEQHEPSASQERRVKATKGELG